MPQPVKREILSEFHVPAREKPTPNTHLRPDRIAYPEPALMRQPARNPRRPDFTTAARCSWKLPRIRRSWGCEGRG